MTQRITDLEDRLGAAIARADAGRCRDRAPRPRRGEFDYINRAYGLSLTKNCAVVQPSTGRRGQVAGAHAGAQHYVDIRWDGNRFASGPFHPTSDLEYPDAAKGGD